MAPARIPEYLSQKSSTENDSTGVCDAGDSAGDGSHAGGGEEGGAEHRARRFPCGRVGRITKQ